VKAKDAEVMENPSRDVGLIGFIALFWSLMRG